MDVTDATFEQEVVERSRREPVVVDFWADWCAPCKALAPALEKGVEERAGEIALAKVDIDANPALAEAYGIRSIPAVKAFRGGHVVDEFVGALSPQAVEAFLDRLAGPSQTARLVDELAASGEFPEILGPLAEENFMNSMISFGNDWTVFFTRPISGVIMAFTLITLMLPVIARVRGKR